MSQVILISNSSKKQLKLFNFMASIIKFKEHFCFLLIMVINIIVIRIPEKEEINKEKSSYGGNNFILIEDSAV